MATAIINNTHNATTKKFTSHITFNINNTIRVEYSNSPIPTKHIITNTTAPTTEITAHMVLPNRRQQQKKPSNPANRLKQFNWDIYDIDYFKIKHGTCCCATYNKEKVTCDACESWMNTFWKEIEENNLI